VRVLRRPVELTFAVIAVSTSSLPSTIASDAYRRAHLGTGKSGQYPPYTSGERAGHSSPLSDTRVPIAFRKLFSVPPALHADSRRGLPQSCLLRQELSLLSESPGFYACRTAGCGKRTHRASAAARDRQPHDERFFRWMRWNMDRERKRSGRNDRFLPWEAYHRARCDAQAARGRFLRDVFFAATKSLKDRICYQARKWDIRLCPLCC
jgi:hypothetical protein